ncbi:hypothetical protein AVEN_274884-1 [Araneus ventricosus]|uniref:DDE-1 domain-containing protein n=1 Tax=Araneus ventricosus TaxID=182803 RepID=A0A4Y2UC19_ARAVE|nr:hypothetical protein AVEN_274884-1 [Araneus ventricosus]
MSMADRTWMNVTQKAIKNCFEKAGFSNVQSESDEELELHTETQQCGEWEKVSKILNLSNTTMFVKFTEFDSEVQVCGLWTDDEIVSQTISSPSSEEEEMGVPTEPNITAIQGKDAVYSDASWNVQKTWKKRTSQLFFELKTWSKSNLKRDVARSLCWTFLRKSK